MEDRNRVVAIDESELQLFINKTIRAVIHGLNDVREYTEPVGENVVIDERGILFSHRVKVGIPESIDMDVAVAVSRRHSSDGSLKLQVVSAGASGGSKLDKESTSTSRVKFSIPLSWRDKK